MNEMTPPARPRQTPSRSGWKLAAALAAVGAVGVLGWYLQSGQPGEQPNVAIAPAPAPALPPAPAPIEEKPAAPPAPIDNTPLVAAPLSLDNSDGQVRAALTEFAPKLAQWLTPEEQVRKWVSLVNQIAEGKLPAKNRPLEYPMPAYRAQQKGQSLHPDPANYKRADQLIQTLTEIPVERLAQYYHAWRPTLDKAYAELGGAGGFDKRLRLAIRRIIATRPLPPEMELVRPVIVYKYTEPQLEQASEVERLTWRLGPENTKRLQEYLRRFEQQM